MFCDIGQRFLAFVKPSASNPKMNTPTQSVLTLGTHQKRQVHLNVINDCHNITNPIKVLEQCNPTKGPIYVKGTLVKGGVVGSLGPGGGIIVAPGLEVQRKDAHRGGETYNDQYRYTDNAIQHFYSWTEAQAVAQSYGAGWHLPTKDELSLLYQQQIIVDGFDGDYSFYWSSTDLSVSVAWFQYFCSGSQYCVSKAYRHLVRAVHAF